MPSAGSGSPTQRFSLARRARSKALKLLTVNLRQRKAAEARAAVKRNRLLEDAVSMRPAAQSKRRPAKGYFAPGLTLKKGDKLVIKFSEAKRYLGEVVGALRGDINWIQKRLGFVKNIATRNYLKCESLPADLVLDEQGSVGDWFRIHFSPTEEIYDAFYRLCDGGRICTKYLDGKGRCACEVGFFLFAMADGCPLISKTLTRSLPKPSTTSLSIPATARAKMIMT